MSARLLESLRNHNQAVQRADVTYRQLLSTIRSAGSHIVEVHQLEGTHGFIVNSDPAMRIAIRLEDSGTRVSVYYCGVAAQSVVNSLITAVAGEGSDQTNAELTPWLRVAEMPQ